MTKGEIPTVVSYQACNYDSKAAFSAAIRICQMEIAQIQNHLLSDLALHYALHANWDDPKWDGLAGWDTVSKYVELAKGLRQVYEMALHVSSDKTD